MRAVRDLSALGELRGLSGQFRMGQLKTKNTEYWFRNCGEARVGHLAKEEDIRGNFIKGEGRKAKKKRYVYAGFTNSEKADWDWLRLNYYKLLNAKRNIVGF